MGGRTVWRDRGGVTESEAYSLGSLCVSVIQRDIVTEVSIFLSPWLDC